jgi:hypothetical protein
MVVHEMTDVCALSFLTIVVAAQKKRESGHAVVWGLPASFYGRKDDFNVRSPISIEYNRRYNKI